MRGTVLGAALCLVLVGVLFGGWVQLRLFDEPWTQTLVAAASHAGGQQVPEEWIKEFDRRRDRLIERLDGKMERLRKRLEGSQGPSKLMLANCG
ncbi:MAG TPA: hypothetical protein PKJ41_21175 [Bryobacteraceae bacterium]|nr:hypothetical protein [Bryobacteraceae bacterium]HPT25264.1 hypothetical protein [Bryobacteraceae bacterium]